MIEQWRRRARAAAYGYRELRRKKRLSAEQRAAVYAVEQALSVMDEMRTAEKRRRLVDLVYIRRTHTLYGAGTELEISEESARAWNRDFLLCVYMALKRGGGP